LHHEIQAVQKRHARWDEVMRIGEPRGPLDRRRAGARPAIGYVVGERTVKQLLM